MTKHNPENERIKRKYFTWMKHARGQSEATVDAAAAAIHRFEEYNRYRAFKTFRAEQAISFKRHLSDTVNNKTGEPLSKATLYGTLKALRVFFQWLSRESGFKRYVNYADADYFNLTENDARIAKAERETPTPSLEQIIHVLNTVPANTVIERRDRAVIAFTILTGARDGAIASFKLKHLDLEKHQVFQDAREVRTKRRKTFTTTFFPVGNLPEKIVNEWVAELRKSYLFGPDDPLFPRTRVAVGSSGLFEAETIERKHWSNAGPIRAIFKVAFKKAGLPYFNPHSFRKTLALLGGKLSPDLETYKAWSQNLGHETMVTTLASYAKVTSQRQTEIIRGFSCRSDTQTDVPDIEQILRTALDAAQRTKRRA